ncbi:hypothetical protein I3843_06G124400 [Carya illinoinensis]|uniref:Kinesin-like protein n=1 Tax=Carya illinoinensis TaxID=32201 RepID=A0A922ESS2_CARIL|nr:hypothetical protein I3760_06G132300 [Carya illinoinensis]KAG6709393.1 hypothetical protein I3842_06G131000 [Carya illinoinensis]KAG7975925.1 hypothetical protein I3843_06G124400 [Carya illinoinensis]
MASSSRARSSSPFSYRKSSTPYSSASSSSSFMNSRIVPRSCSSSAASFFNTSGGLGSRSITPSRSRSDSMYSVPRAYNNPSPVGFASEDLISEPIGSPGSADSISVTIRFRPLSEREYQRGDEIAWYADGDKIVRNEYNPATAYAFDRVFGPHTTSPEVYEVAAQPVVKAAMEGVNGTVFAYGVTSSGKTHTMHGDQNSPGIIPLAIKDVFSIIQDTPGREFLLRVSYLEIYNEVINDLLDPTGQNLRVREDAQGTYVEGIKEEVVLSPGHALSFIAAGEEHRHVGSNNFNLLSSRSHTIFTLMIESSADGDEYDGVIFSQLNLIDLAGSESSKTETTGLRRKEGSYINKSLLTLGTVIGKLSEGKASHVPYRDSKLTRLLQSSLSGHGHVSLICTVTPASSNMEETHNTLKFASRAKRVEIYASRNKIIDEKSLIKKYQREISTLKEELDQLRRGMLVGVSHEEILTLKQKLEEGQVKMQSRLEEEEEAKAALMSRIQKLTKLILVSSKNTIPGYLSDIPSHQRSHSVGEDDGLLLEGENQKDSLSSASAAPADASFDFKHRRSSSKWSEDLSPSGSAITESTHAGELISDSKLPTGGMTMSDQMDLLVEQVKMLAGEIAFSTSTLKRLVEQSVNDPDSSKTQIQNLEHEIQEKKRQMRVLEQRIIENGEVTKLSLQNAKLEKELLAARDLAHSRSAAMQTMNGVNRKFNDGTKNGRKGKLSGRGYEISGAGCDEFESWNLDPEDLKMELQARKQREAVLEAALTEKEFIEDEFRKKIEEAKKREEALENDLANMWVLVAKLKKEGGAISELNTDERNGEGTEFISDPKTNVLETNTVRKESEVLDVSNPADEIPKEEPLVVRLKARMQEMKEKELKYLGNGDANSHMCKVCFESPTAAILLPCRHFCLCKSCSLACSECPLCRTKIADRLFAFTS